MAGSLLDRGQLAAKRARPNNGTRAIKEFLAQLVDDAGGQDAVRERALGGDAVAFFRVIDHVLGRPRERIDADQTGTITVRWEDSLIERLENGRKRVAEANRDS